MILLLIIGAIFIARFFYTLNYEKKNYAYLNMFFGVLVFLLIYILSTLFATFITSLLFERISFSSEILINCFTIPFSLFISGIHYKIIKNRLKKNKKEIDKIGRQ